ncbi:hypothetical protein PGTUg99_036600 [Puccinia graminis f. sp. tritici]|uniref:RNA polymerase II-associated protein 1 C-terminal domain-containing protein n=1 Tax=Puccinia graminis f. sp. tritici TaxID=56615 RepID=A0A5B0R9N2_PUCGR|nr:hypothetical protein PGTUg99_036600 [Puccinia graminis f. sp. tritici]
MDNEREHRMFTNCIKNQYTYIALGCWLCLTTVVELLFSVGQTETSVFIQIERPFLFRFVTIDMYTGSSSDHERQSIRPSLADLASDDFFEKLQVEANQLRNTQTFTANNSNPNALPPLGSIRAKAEPPSASTPKKSRFAQQREAKLHSSQSSDSNLPVPTGRFNFDLGLEDNDSRDRSQANETDSKSPPPLMAEIVERSSSTSNPPNNCFDPNFRPDAVSAVKPPTFNTPQASVPPWELRRLASRHSSQNSQRTSIEKPDFPMTQNQHSSDVLPGGSAKEPFNETEKRQISSENEALLSQMSPDEILREQAAIKAQLMQSNPDLLAKLLTKFKKQTPSHQVPTDILTPPAPDIPTPLAPTPKEQKHVRYAQDDVIPIDSPSPQKEKGSCMPNQHIKPNSDGSNDCSQSIPLRFDWNGVRVIDHEDPHQVDRSSEENLHVHHTSTYTVRQLLRLILSSVPSQRIMGFKIVTQIVVRYFETSGHGLDDIQLALLTEELNGASLEIMTIAAQATRERNLGIATSALTLLGSILSKASAAQSSSSKHKCIVQPAWIEELITQTTILADFHSHLQYQELPRLSLTAIVQILRDLIILGDSAKVSEEIVKRPSFLELLIQVLIAVPWPLNSKSKLEVPDLSAFELLLELSKSSRTCSRSILDRGLLTPMLRFIALPYWSLVGTSESATEGLIPAPNDHVMGVLIRSMCYQFDLISVFAGYGLGANLRTTLDPLLRTTTIGLHNILKDAVSGSSSVPPCRAAQEFTLISAFLKLLQSWIQCADDSHICDPPHSITWSQVTEWESSILDFLRLSSISNSRSPGSNKVLASACDSLSTYIGRSFTKKLRISACLVSLDFVMPQLESIFQTIAHNVVNSSYEDYRSQSESFQYQLLISFARLKTCLSRSKSEEHPSLPATHFQHDFPDKTFALTCRLAFDYEELSLLPWALSVFHPNGDSTSDLHRILMAGLLVRNSDGIIVSDLLAETFKRCQSRVNAECQNSIKPSTPVIDLSRLLPIFNDYVDQSAPSTQISDPSPHQLQNQMSQNDKSAFLLSSTWPLLAIAFLKPGHLASTTITSKIKSSEVVRASFAMTVVVQSLLCDMQSRFESLSNIFQALLLDKLSTWKNVITAIIATTSQTYCLDHQSTEESLESVFEDEASAQLIIRLMNISHQHPSRRSQSKATKPMSRSEILKFQESEDGELYMLFTNILAAFDWGSFGNHSFMRILVPFLSMKRGREFRGKLFSDHGDILKNMRISLGDVFGVDDEVCGERVEVDYQQLKEYLYPVEENAQMLHLFAEFLSKHSTLINPKDHPFLFLYLIHHLSSQIWNVNLEPRLRMDLLKVILSKAQDERICRALLRYDQPAPSNDRSGATSPWTLRLTIFDQESDGDHLDNRCKLLSLRELFSSLPGDHHASIDRLRKFGWDLLETQP